MRSLFLKNDLVKNRHNKLMLSKMTEHKRIGLKEAIAALRSELIESTLASRGKGLRFEVGEIKMEFQIEVERSADVKGGIKFWVVDLGTRGRIKDKDVHKIVIPLKPVDVRHSTADPRPILTGSDEVPD